jgi:peroxiredoxin
MNACDQQKYHLHGKIEGIESGTIILNIKTMTQYRTDTTIINKNEFTFTGKVTEPTEAFFVINGQLSNVFYIEPSIMSIDLIKDKFDKLKITGSKTQDAKFVLDKQLDLIREHKKDLKYQYRIINDSIKNITDKTKLKLFEEKLSDINYRVSSIDNQIDSIKLNSIKSHPDSFLSAYLLLMFNVNEVISMDLLKLLFNNLDLKIKNSIPGKIIQNDILKKERNIIGAEAPNFSFTNKAGEISSLSESKGKCIIIDVWASWCIPCRGSFPHLQSLFEEYHSKGLEIFAISLDQNRKKWEQAIKEDHIENWQHSIIGTSQPRETDFYKNYYFQGIPHLFLIAKNGKIAGNWVGTSVANDQELEKALKDIFR